MAKAAKKPAQKAAMKPAKKADSKKDASREILVVTSKVKEYIKSLGLQSSSEVVPALSEKIYQLLESGALRTKNNNRATLRPHDL
jgi:hypothetical protein